MWAYHCMCLLLLRIGGRQRWAWSGRGVYIANPCLIWEYLFFCTCTSIFYPLQGLCTRYYDLGSVPMNSVFSCTIVENGLNSHAEVPGIQKYLRSTPKMQIYVESYDAWAHSKLAKQFINPIPCGSCASWQNLCQSQVHQYVRLYIQILQLGWTK